MTAVPSPDLVSVPRGYRYRAFISYSHQDRALAHRLQIALQQLAKQRRTQIRNISLFRDETNLSANPNLWKSIEQGLDDSEFLIYFASPEAVRSPWVNKEIEHWLARRSAERILIVWLRGQLPWVSGSAVDEHSASIPRVLQDHLTSEPLYVDFTWATAPDADLSDSNPVFLNAVARLAAPLHGKEPNELIGEEVEQQRKRAFVYRMVATALGVLAVAAGAAAIIATYQRAEAIRRQTLASARQLIAQAEIIRTQQPDRLETGALLALESLKRFDEVGVPSDEADQTLRAVLRVLPRAGFAPLAHPRLTHVTFGPSAEWVATAGGDGMVRLWDTAAGRPIGELTHGAPVNSLHVDPNGMSIVSAGDDGIVRVWDLATRRETHRFAHDAKATSAGFSPNAALIASSGWDGTVRLWNLATRQQVATLVHEREGRPTDVRGVVFSGDGAYVATFDPFSVSVWDIRRQRDARVMGRERHRVFERKERDVLAIAFSPVAEHLAVAARDGSVTLLEVTSGRALFTVNHDAAVSSIAFSPRGDRLATASHDGTVRVWNAVSGMPIARATHDAEVWAVAFDSTGDYLASASSDRTGRVWELPSAREVARVGHSNLVQAIAVSPIGLRVVTGDVGGLARVVEVASGDTHLRLHHAPGIEALAIDSSQEHAALVSSSGVGAFWDLVIGRSMPLQHGRARATASSMDRAGSLALSRWDRSVELWAESGASTIATYEADARAIALHGGSQHRLLAFALDPNIIEVRALDSPHPRWRGMHQGRVEDVAFSADGRQVASASADGTVCVWDTLDGAVVHCAPHGRPLTVVAFGGDRRELVTGDIHGVIDLADVGADQPRVTIQHDAGVTVLAVTLDGQFVAAGSENGTVGVWRTADAARIATIRHSDRISGVAFISNARYLVTTAIDGSASVSWWRPEHLADEACSRLAANLGVNDRRTYVDDASAADTCDPALLGRAYRTPSRTPH